tara:strand:- start:908 stop:1195 length:288 start_codon:yes stop_codon:yes gene_type:complete
MKRNSKSEKIGELVYQFFQKNNLKSKEKAVNLMEVWGDVMGKHVLLETKQVYLKNNTLSVYIINSALKQDLNFSKSDILEKFNSYNLGISKISFY